MSQTTDQARGKASGSSFSKRKSRSAGASLASPPSPPKRRRPALTALAVLLIVGGAALAGLLAVRMDSREPVIVVDANVATGELIKPEMLRSTNVSGDGLNVISYDQRGQVANKLYARQTIYKGQLLQKSLLRTKPPLATDQAQVGVPLTSGKFPPGLRGGDAVRLVRIGDSQNPSQALCTGYVLEVTKSKSGGFGSDSKSAVATVVVPQDVVDQVVGATGGDNLGIALIGRGVAIDDAQITNLLPAGKN